MVSGRKGMGGLSLKRGTAGEYFFSFFVSGSGIHCEELVVLRGL